MRTSCPSGTIRRCPSVVRVSGGNRTERAHPGPDTIRGMILEVGLSRSGELVHIVVVDDPRLIHDRGTAVTVLVVQVEGMSDLVRRGPQVLSAVATHGGVLVEVGEGPPVVAGPHKAHHSGIAGAIVLFIIVVHHDPIHMIPTAGAIEDPETAGPAAVPHR